MDQFEINSRTLLCQFVDRDLSEFRYRQTSSPVNCHSRGIDSDRDSTNESRL